MLMDKHSQNETNIKNRFNRLVSQFEANPRYHEPGMDFRIPEKENISYEMIVNKKIYEAAFYQKSDSSTIRNQVLQELKNEYTEEQLNNPDESLEQLILIKTFSHELDSFSKKSVWFRINERFGKYYIVMYYDNEYNHANGEDL